MIVKDILQEIQRIPVTCDCNIIGFSFDGKKLTVEVENDNRQREGIQRSNKYKTEN